MWLNAGPWQAIDSFVPTKESIMRYKSSSAVIATSLATILTPAAALAQSGPPGMAAVASPATPPALAAPMSVGNNTSGVNQPGAPNTSTPGLIGTGATPSGLPGDSTHHPGFPSRGRH